MEDKIAQALGGDDYWASPTTQIFAFIGVLFLSVKILSFWRMIASLFVLRGTSVSTIQCDG
jgi:17beta-estradiol 17-dehydrogenase / very-long-chain 3-oxoacyl-CoA reductase